jgi:hypothetical protein
MRKKKMSRNVLSYLVFLGLALSLNAAEQYGPNLIYNGDFSVDAGAKAKGWGTGLYNGAQGEVTREKAADLPGAEWALRLKHSPPIKGLVQSSGRRCAVPDDNRPHKLRLACQYKGKGSIQLRFSHGEAGKIVPLKNSAGKKVWLTKQLPEVSSWTKIERVWDLPAELFQPKTSFSPIVQLWSTPLELTLTDMSVQIDGQSPAAASTPSPSAKKAPTSSNVAPVSTSAAPTFSGGRITYSPPTPLPINEESSWEGRAAPFSLTINNGLFLKDGKPSYLLGTLGAGWGVNSLWLRRVLDYDYSSIGWGDNISARTRPTDAGGKELEISFTETLPLYSYCSETVRNKQLPQLASGGSHAYGPLRHHLKAFPEIKEFFSQANHGIPYDFHSSVGRDVYKGGFENKLKYLNRLPLLAYEIYREPGYRPIRQRVRTGFTKFVRAKYGNLALANQAWRSTFKTWDQIEPPHLKDTALLFGWSDKIAKIESVYKKQPEMYNDWLEYLRHDFYTGTLALKSIFKQLSDKPFTYDCRTQRSYFDGYGAIDPELVAEVVDIFFCHTSYRFFQYNNQPADQNSLLISLMDSLLYHDFLSDNVDKPILNTENIVTKVSVSGSSAQAMINNCFGKFHGKAPFKLVPAEKDVDPAWTKADFDDSGWGEIPVPGPWDETEAYKGKNGWGCYRFHFKMPGGLVKQNYLDGTCRYLIYGKGVAQKGQLWLNGQKIGEPKGWQTKYQYDVSGLLNYGGDNTLAFVVDGSKFYAEGIRFYLHLLADNMLNEARPVSKKHYATMLWSNLVHGCSGNTFWHWDKYAHWYMPELKAAISSAAPIVLPQAGPTGKIAMLYPYQSFRGMLNTGGKVYLDYMSYFGAATFNHVPTDILSCRKLVAMPAGRYPMLLLPYAHLVRKGCFERVEQFVNDGGLAVITYDSLIQDDWLYQNLPVEELAGVKVLGDVSTENPTLSFNGKTYKLTVGDMTGKAGVRIEARGAETIGVYSDGSPAITIKKHGKGQVCYVAARLDMSAAQDLLEKLMTEEKIQTPLEISSANKQEAPFVETRLIGGPERFVLYLLNWGGQAHDLKVKITNPAFLSSRYRVRDIVKAAGDPQEATTYAASNLKNGITVSVMPQEPVALLFESTGTEPMALTSVSPAKQKMLSDLENLFANSAKPTGKPKVLFLTDLRDDHKDYGPELYPIVCQMLRRAGFELQTLPSKTITPEKLREFSLVFLGEECGIPYKNLLQTNFPDHLTSYLKEGGNLMLLFSSNSIMSNSMRSALMVRILSPAFKVTQGGWCENPKSCGYGDPLQIWTDNIAKHPVTRHVSNLQFFVASTMKSYNKDFIPLVLAKADDLRQPSKPLAMAAEIAGGGRIFLAGDTLWAQPERVEEMDNLQFLANAIDWLAKKPIQKIDKPALVDQLIVSTAKLRQAEK